MRTLRLIGDLVRGLTSLAAIAALVGVPPFLLARYVGWPLPRVVNLDEIHHALGGASISDAFLIKTLAIACWIAWAQVLWCTLVECAAWARGRAASAVPLSGLVQPMVRQLVVSGALVFGSIRPTVALPRAPQPAPVVQITPALAAALPPPVAAPSPPATAEPTCTVRRRDSLWLLAEQHLGHGMRWREIYDLNRGRPQPGGRTLRYPNLIRPGWVLRMPADAVGLSTPPIAAPAPAPAPAAAPAPDSDADPPDVHPPEPVPRRSEIPATTVAPPRTEPMPSTSTTTLSVPAPQPDRHVPAPVDDPADDHFPVPTTLAGVTLLAAGVVITIDRLRRRQMRHRQPGRMIPLPTGAAQGAERLLRAAAATRPANRLDLALRLLGHCLVHSTDADRTRIDAVRVDGDRIEILLTNPVSARPGPFEAPGGQVWTLPADADDTQLTETASRSTAPSPALVTVGRLNGQPVLVDLEHMPLTLTGDRQRATTFIWSLALELATSVWADDLRVIVVGTAPPGLAGLDRIETVDSLAPLIPELELDEEAAREALAAASYGSRWSARIAGAGDAWAPTVILVTPDADEALMTPPGVGFVRWSEQAPPGGRTLHLGEDRDRLEPLGLDLDHASISEDLMRATAEVIAVALSEEPGPELNPEPAPPPVATPRTPPSSYPIDLRTQSEPFDVTAPDPDRVLVRIFGPVRIEGAKHPIQRRRIKELIVYLALHPEGVTDEQIMIALWPGETPTRSAFNQTVSRARAALGTASDGQPLIPYIENGLYRPSRHLLSDLDLLERHSQFGDAGDAPDGEPFSGSDGFEWAYVEGHAHRAAALAERARTLPAREPAR